MARPGYAFSRSQGKWVKWNKREVVNYDNFATPQWALLVAMFRYYPDILEDLVQSDNPAYVNSLLGRVAKRAMARNERTFLYACRGFGKTSDIISERCNRGILYPGEIVGYYAPAENQAAPIASKAFADYKRNYPILADHWDVSSESKESFKMLTVNSSQFTMKVPRGVDTSSLIAEECGQEDATPFDWTNFNQIVMPTNRKVYRINGEPDQKAISLQVCYITSASRKENEAFRVCEQIRNDMRQGEKSFACWIPWEAVVLCGMKPYVYYRNLKRQLTADQFMRECESKCTGSIQDPIIRDSVLQSMRRVKLMEDRHCGDPEAFYILGYDVSSRDVSGNAKTAMSVLKCERQYDTSKWDRYRKSAVYLTESPPPVSAEEHARQIKRRWNDYRCASSKHETLIIIDARQYGQSVIEQLHRDLGDGLPPLATITGEEPYNALEQEGCIRCIYPMQATGTAGRDPNSEMIDYLSREAENGNLRLLTANLNEGMTAYKLKHNITDDSDNVSIQYPYLKTNRLCQQIGNLQRKYTSVGYIEKEISKSIPKDIYSSLLYACRLAQRIEKESLYYENRRHNVWAEEAENFQPNEPGLSNIPIRTRSVKRLGRGAIK